MESEPILVNGIRVLGPFEIDKLAQAIKPDKYYSIFEVCLWSGMRYVEIQRLHGHPEWWLPDRRSIHLPKTAQKKVKRKQLERHVHPVPLALGNELRRFFAGPAPITRRGWNMALVRWAEAAGLDPVGISAKTTRKTIESWMISAGVPINIVCLRQGHDSMTSMSHYQGLPFTDAEKVEIKNRLSGWII